MLQIESVHAAACLLCVSCSSVCVVPDVVEACVLGAVGENIPPQLPQLGPAAAVHGLSE